MIPSIFSKKSWHPRWGLHSKTEKRTACNWLTFWGKEKTKNIFLMIQLAANILRGLAGDYYSPGGGHQGGPSNGAIITLIAIGLVILVLLLHTLWEKSEALRENPKK